ncbi:carotenoid oxygenase family protein [Hyphomonas sp. WL0036]|uniref:8'-apo-carotenoid 13,14-cleaving dioxygenase n=1 Tax=Hyphomonas sediminis TaxID=2866160 RepID=UPI001C7E66D9|nr:carotenoid oxygenase family protein [Hyphomonas sediminis]MBY9066210.1 carotenoid oxygenase family protein [Hyphomonas sediminis]
MPSPVEAAIRGVVTQGVMALANFNRNHRKMKGTNPFLSGIHSPLAAEFIEDNLQVTGQIPEGLNGLYVRNGPNPLQKVNPATHHWFTGDAMLHGVRLQGGKALWYRNRWVRSNSVSDALGEPRAPGPRNPRTDNPNTNIVGHAGKIWAVVEAGGFPVEVSEDLETRAHSDFNGLIGESYSAHPHYDPDTGEMHAICYNPLNPVTIFHTVIDAQGKVCRREPIPVEHGPMIHDCMITPHYVIIMDLPVTFSMASMVGGISLPYRWNSKHAARIGLLPRHGNAADVVWCEVDPCFIFHPANAFETDDGKVVLDACVYETMFDSDARGPDTTYARFQRLEINPANKRVTRTTLDAAPQEFPRYDERRTGKPYRFAYTVALPEHGDAAFLNETRLFKHDLETGKRQVHDFGEGNVPGEFVFVPASENAGEGDGWLIGYVINTRSEQSQLVILDAANFEGAPVAAINIPHRIPPGFHGNFIAMN